MNNNISFSSEINGRQQLMLLLMFIIGRVLILRILFRPWNFSEKIKESADLKINMKVLQSVIYEILVEYLRNSCPPIQNNQAMLSTEKKIKEIPRIPAVYFQSIHFTMQLLYALYIKKLRQPMIQWIPLCIRRHKRMMNLLCQVFSKEAHLNQYLLELKTQHGWKL